MRLKFELAFDLHADSTIETSLSYRFFFVSCSKSVSIEVLTAQGRWSWFIGGLGLLQMQISHSVTRAWGQIGWAAVTICLQWWTFIISISQARYLLAAKPLPLYHWVKKTTLALGIIICQSLKSALPEEKVAEIELGAQLGKGLSVWQVNLTFYLVKLSKLK